MWHTKDLWRKFVVPNKRQFYFKCKRRISLPKGVYDQEKNRKYKFCFIYLFCLLYLVLCHVASRAQHNTLSADIGPIDSRKEKVGLHTRYTNRFTYSSDRTTYFCDSITQRLMVRLRDMNKLNRSIISRHEGCSLIVMVVAVAVKKTV